jgi:hypothetical protein
MTGASDERFFLLEISLTLPARGRSCYLLSVRALAMGEWKRRRHGGVKEKEGKRERLRGRFSNQLCLDLTIRFFLRLLNECNPLSLSWPQTINTCFVEIFTLMIIVKSNLGQTQGHCTYGYRWMDTLRFALGVEARHCFMKERWERNSLGLLNSCYYKAARWEFPKSETKPSGTEISNFVFLARALCFAPRFRSLSNVSSALCFRCFRCF